MRTIIKSTFFVSSFAPMILFLGITVFIKDGLLVEFLGFGLPFLVLSIFSCVILRHAERRGQALEIRIRKIESNDTLLVPILLTQTSPSILKSLNMDLHLVNVVVLGLFAVGMVVAYVPVHPVLRFFGYRFYKAETEDGLVLTIITRREVLDRMSLHCVARVAENLFVERDRIAGHLERCG